MESTRNDTSVGISSRSTNIDRCTIVTAALCLVVGTVAFFGSVATIVWLFEHKVPYKYSVVCFMVGSGILYIVAFTSSLLLLTKGHSQRSRPVSREVPSVGLAGRAQNDGGCETASDISYRGSARLLQLPQMVNATQTPPPPYKDPSKTSSQNDQVQSTEDSNSAGSSLNRFYYELSREEVQERQEVDRQRPFQQEPMATGFDIEMEPMLTSHTSSSNNSYPLTKALKQQMASNSSLPIETQSGEFRESLQKPIGSSKPQTSISSENSPRSALKVKRNPSQVAKRKLKATLSMSHPDLLSEVGSSRLDCNGDTRSLQINLNSQGTPRIPRSNAEERSSQSSLSLRGRQRDFRLDCNEESRSSQSNSNYQGTPRLPRSNPETRTSFSNLNPQGTPRLPRSNPEGQTSLSNSNPQGTPRLPRSNPETRTSLSNLNPQGTPRILVSNAEVRTSGSNLAPERRMQASRLDLNEESKSSMSNLKPEGTPQLSRSNIVRTSQMNLIPGARLQASQHSLNVDIERSSNLNSEDRKQESLSNLNSKRKQFESKIVHTDKRFTSHSNLHLNTQQSNSNVYSYGLQRVPQVDTNSNASLNNSRSNMVGVDLKHTSQPVKQFQKLSQTQFAAYSKSVPSLQKAQSFTSLSESNTLTQVEMETVPKTACKEHLTNVSSSRQMSGRSTESVLDASRNNKQMTPQEWIVAWNNGFRKLPTKETDRIVGVRI